MSPLDRNLAISPVLYIRSLEPAGANGFRMNRSAVSSGFFQYPAASPPPAAYSSPGTPIGTGLRWRSNMYTRVFEIGRPIGTLPRFSCALLIKWQHVNVVFSVGP